MGTPNGGSTGHGGPLLLEATRLALESTEPLTHGAESYVTRSQFPADVNNDCKVTIVGVAMLADSYGARLGEEGYHAVLDITSDGSIDIFDVALVANYYDQACSYRG